MREDGINAGYRRIGTFFLWSIPLSLGAAACVWLGFAMAAHGWFNMLSQEDRRAIYVGAQQLPKSKMKVLTPDVGCVVIDKVDLDGESASVYFHSQCRQEVDSLTVKWQLVSPNGTFLASDFNYVSLLHGPASIEPHEKGEAILDGWLYGIKPDSRAESIIFKMGWHQR